METRHVIAYVLIAILAAGAGALIVYARSNRHDRKVARQRAREDDARMKRIQEAADSATG